MGSHFGVHGGGQTRESTSPIPKLERVRTSSLRSRESEKYRFVGADAPAPKRLSRKVAPSGEEPVVPGIVSVMSELAGTGVSESLDLVTQ